MRTVLALVLFALPAVAETSLDGLYRPAGSSWDCTSVGSDGGAMAIRDGVFHGVESACTLTRPTPVNGMNAVLFDAECTGEGETYGFRVMFMPVEERLAMIQDGAISELERFN